MFDCLSYRGVLPFIAIFAMLSGGAFGEDSAKAVQVKEDPGFGIDEKLGNQIPLGLKFRNERGDPVLLKQLLDGKKTTLLTLNYSNCPGLCVAQLDGLSNSLRTFDAMTIGQEYQVITISIDPKETYQRAAATKEKYIRDLNLVQNTPAWRFLTGDQPQITEIADAVGFRYSYDEQSKRYNHSAATIVISPEGRVTRYLYSPTIDGNTLRMALIEGSEGKLGTSLDSFALWCMEYDPESNRYSAVAFRILAFGAGAFLFVLVALVTPFWFAGKRTSNDAEPTPADETIGSQDEAVKETDESVELTDVGSASPRS